MFKEFKAFVARGNVLDLAVGVIIGAAFTAIVNSLVENLINPLLGMFVGSIDFSNLVLTVGQAHFRYGAFINAIINFIIIAFVVFLLVKTINKVLPAPKKEEEAEPTAEEKYLQEIVTLLKKEEH
ncbi:large-conductance mechanosensitive channel protein MscL [Levilactobacillus suantsaii]|uniref:Large-conductance mechanosensitive channel n=1 Tax=Levilactobacillus suantsaii TaxID=2292255 RepID=A0A4V1LFK4_9LACO|nr:large-conductance mechanosensitive channel protein MscL [Levilactobacillus suantsaii]QMU07550.1 large-conductance mechanosensitive channel protein MscL [Levilactobacillus suantsaii]RXI79625.1 large-conductance mechanosensitive channel protein MscL [Levilactobacillus suantsaii]